MAFAELQEGVLADGKYYHGPGTYLFGHDQPTNDDFERFIKGLWEIDS